MGSCSSRKKSAQNLRWREGGRFHGLGRRRTKESRGGLYEEEVNDETPYCDVPHRTMKTNSRSEPISTRVEAATLLSASNSRGILEPSRKGDHRRCPSIEDDTFVLPIELLRSGVLTFLCGRSLGQAGITCVTWRSASTDESLWKGLCLKHWLGKHVALLEGLVEHESCAAQREDRTADSPAVDAGDGLAKRRSQQHQGLVERAAGLQGGLEDLVAAMPIKTMKRRLEELGANPRRLTTCLEKGECVSLVMGSMLLSREGLVREGGQLPPWVSLLRGWRWSYYYAKADARRCWLSMDDLVRFPWTMSFPADIPTPASPLLVTCKFHRNFCYTDEGFYQNGLDWHFEDSHRCVKVSSYPALEAERDPSWGWRLVNAHVIFEQQRRPP